MTRFLDEAKIIGQLQHSGIVGMHGVGVTAAGIYFIVMDLIDGVTLEKLSTLPETPVLVSWMTELADALQSAHAASVVHCDLKPSNVMVGTDGRLIVTDFGLARVLHDTESQRRSIAGTALWMAPEQVDESFGPVTPKTDVYGFGALLYTLLTGKPPFPGKRVSDILSRVISAEQPVAPSTVRGDVPADLEQLCLQCMEKQQNRRLESMVDVASVLRQIDA